MQRKCHTRCDKDKIVSQAFRGGFLAFFALFSIFVRSELFAGEPTANWKFDWEETQRGAEKEGRLVLYGPTGADQQKLYTEVFQQAFPKIKVNYTPGRISELISRIMAEQRAGIRQADLILGGTDTLLGTLKNKGYLQPIRPALILPNVLDTTAWFKGKLWFADKEDKFIPMWRAVPYTGACINTNLVKANELKSYWDLLQPKWKGKIVSQDLRNGSARNQMYTVYGVLKRRAFLSVHNQEVSCKTRLLNSQPRRSSNIWIEPAMACSVGLDA